MAGFRSIASNLKHLVKLLSGALKDVGLREQAMVMVGGAPVTESYANHIGADGYAEDAISAVDLAMRLVDAPA
jgi:5-methyltetrahydrofolate--homocysteine methyltransferase